MSMSCVSVSNRGGTVERGPVKKSNVGWYDLLELGSGS